MPHLQNFGPPWCVGHSFWNTLESAHAPAHTAHSARKTHQAMSTRHLAAAVLLAWSAAGSACDSSVPEDYGERAYAGRYDLVSVEGSPLPYLISRDGSDRLELTGGNVRMRSDHTFSASLAFKVTASGLFGSSSETESGHYELTGTSIRLTYRDGTTDSGLLLGDTLIVDWSGFSLVFRK